MSRILELLKNAKVKWKRLGEVCVFEKGDVITKKDVIEGDVPVVAGGRKPAYFHNKSNRESKTIAIASSGNAGFVSYWDIPIFLSDAFSVRPNEKLNIKYLYHWLLMNQQKIYKLQKIGGVPHVYSKDLAPFIIPIPPLEVQKEIARILDAFAELTLRKKQYEYYRNVILNNAKGRECKLSDVSTFVRGPFGSSLRKSYFKPDGYAVYEQRHAIYASLEIRYFIDEKKFNELKRFEVMAGDIIVCCSGTIGNAFVIPEGAPKGIINQALLILRPKGDVLADYIKYIFENRIKEELIKGSRGGAIKNVRPINEIKEIKILIPSLEEQKNIVKILDKMQKLSNETQGLIPAEIALRKKQYEYYRKRLVSFDRT